MDLTPELEEAIKTTQERHAVYGDGYLRNAAVMAALFPSGLQVTTEREWLHFYFLFMVVLKLVRYSYSFEMGEPHIDSVHDLGLYALMATKLQREDTAPAPATEPTTVRAAPATVPEGTFHPLYSLKTEIDSKENSSALDSTVLDYEGVWDKGDEGMKD